MLFMPCFWKIVINLSLNYPSSIRWPEDHISLSTRTQVSNVKSCGSSHLSAGLTLNGTNNTCCSFYYPRLDAITLIYLCLATAFREKYYKLKTNKH